MFIQRTLTYFLRGSITVLRLNFCLTGFDLAKRVNVLWIKHKQSSWILTSLTTGQLYSDTSRYEVSECSLVHYQFRWLLDSNCGPLVWEATTLPTESQILLPIKAFCLQVNSKVDWHGARRHCFIRDCISNPWFLTRNGKLGMKYLIRMSYFAPPQQAAHSELNTFALSVFLKMDHCPTLFLLFCLLNTVDKK